MNVYQSYFQHPGHMNILYPILEKMNLEKVSNYQRFEDLKLSRH
jgi:hypothetical protein